MTKNNDMWKRYGFSIWIFGAPKKMYPIEPALKILSSREYKDTKEGPLNITFVLECQFRNTCGRSGKRITISESWAAISKHRGWVFFFVPAEMTLTMMRAIHHRLQLRFTVQHDKQVWQSPRVSELPRNKTAWVQREVEQGDEFLLELLTTISSSACKVPKLIRVAVKPVEDLWVDRVGCLDAFLEDRIAAPGRKLNLLRLVKIRISTRYHVSILELH